MKIDLMCSNSYGGYNIRIAQLFGLHTAVYLDELINQCREKVNTVDGFFSVSRKKVTDKTTLSKEEQLTIDKVLMELQILDASVQKSDTIRLDLSTLGDYLELDKASTKKAITERIERILTPENINNTKVTKADSEKIRIVEGLRRYVDADFPTEVKMAFYQWIDIMYDKKKANRVVIETANKAVKNYAQGSNQRAIDLLTYASINSYVDLSKAVEWYKKSLEKQTKNTPYVAQTASYSAMPTPKEVEGGHTF